MTHNTTPDQPALVSPSRAWLESRVRQLIDEDSGIDPAENLILYGLDSLRVMTLAADLKERGVHLSFEDLARAPTLNAWWALIEQRRHFV